MSRYSHPLDQPVFMMLMAVVLVLVYGLIMLASASIMVSQQHFHTPWHYFFNQLIHLGLSAGLWLVAVMIPVEYWRRYSRWLLLLMIIALVVVLIPGIGHKVNGARRWLSLGFLNIQPSEFVKCFFSLYLAQYFSQLMSQRRGIEQMPWPVVLVVTLICSLLIVEPDYGSLLVICVIFSTVLFLSGLPLRYFICFVGFLSVILVLCLWVSPYRVMRVMSYLHPWLDPYNQGYQLTQSLMAIGRGGFWGAGLGHSLQKLSYLPESHTDFLFAITVEELGLIGAGLLLGLFVLFFFNLFKMVVYFSRAEEWFATLYLSAIGTWYFVQMVVNIGVNSGLLPTKGLTLPFFSYGGSSLLANSLALGIMVALYRHERYHGYIRRAD